MQDVLAPYKAGNGSEARGQRGVRAVVVLAEGRAAWAAHSHIRPSVTPFECFMCQLNAHVIGSRTRQ